MAMPATTRWTADMVRALPEILAEQLEWRPDPALLPLVIDLPSYFGEAAGE